MLAAAVSLVVYVAAAFFPGQDEPRYAVFSTKERCEASVAEVRAQGIFVSDCVAVTIGTPRVAPNKGA